MCGLDFCLSFTQDHHQKCLAISLDQLNHCYCTTAANTHEERHES